MSVKKKITERYGAFYITITCYRWLPLFHLTNGYDIVYKWFDYLISNGHFILGFVIMPNHLHAMIAFRNTGEKSINSLIGNGKRFMAYEIISRLKGMNKDKLLSELQSSVNEREKKKGKLHEVFEASFDWKELYSEKFFEQKLNYIHKNPYQGKWEEINASGEYLHSSQRFYETGEQGIYPVMNYMELKDLDLSMEM
jgi:REP element-mobilizing transposase RayT